MLQGTEWVIEPQLLWSIRTRSGFFGVGGIGPEFKAQLIVHCDQNSPDVNVPRNMEILASHWPPSGGNMFSPWVPSDVPVSSLTSKRVLECLSRSVDYLIVMEEDGQRPSERERILLDGTMGSFVKSLDPQSLWDKARETLQDAHRYFVVEETRGVFAHLCVGHDPWNLQRKKVKDPSREKKALLETLKYRGLDAEGYALLSGKGGKKQRAIRYYLDWNPEEASYPGSQSDLEWARMWDQLGYFVKRAQSVVVCAPHEGVNLFLVQRLRDIGFEGKRVGEDLYLWSPIHSLIQLLGQDGARIYMRYVNGLEIILLEE